MPYNADLRCSYCSVELNMSWFYEAMSEYDIEFDFKPTYPHYGSLQDEKEAVKYTIALFEAHIERAFEDWTVYKVFGHEFERTVKNRGRNFDGKYEHYDSVWEFLREIAEVYCEDSKVKMLMKDEDGNVIDSEEESESDDEVFYPGYCHHKGTPLQRNGDGTYYCGDCDNECDK